MKCKVKNNVYCEGRQYVVGEEISEKEAELLGESNYEKVESEDKKKDEKEESEGDQE